MRRQWRDPSRGEVDYSHVRIILNTGDFGPFTAWQFAKTLGHEGFHAKDWGSGKYTLTGAGRHGHLLDPAYEDWRYPPMRRYYKEMAALGAFFPSAKGAIPW